MLNTTQTTPWYKQFWPWFLLFLPACAVVASISTFIIAQKNSPSLVIKNYYKEGLAFNSKAKLLTKAKELGISSTLSLDKRMLTIHLKGQHGHPPLIRVSLRHSTISQHDKVLTLVEMSDSTYQAPFVLPKPGKWYLNIKNPSATWSIDLVSHFTQP